MGYLMGYQTCGLKAPAAFRRGDEKLRLVGTLQQYLH